MAFSPQTKHEFKRADVFALNPLDLKIDWSKNLARQGHEPPIDQDLKALARSMLPKTMGGHGQLQPVIVRPLPDRSLQLIGGFRRARAALWLLESGECPDFQIQCVIRRLNDQEAALGNLVENLDRKEMSPLELAYAVRSLNEDYLLPMEEIASRLKRSKAWLERVLDLTLLAEPIKESVQNGQTSVTAALELAKADPSKQIELFDQAKDTDGRVKAREVNRVKREQGEAVKRTVRHLKIALEELSGPAESPNGKRLIKAILGFLDGSLNETQFYDRWVKEFPPKA